MIESPAIPFNFSTNTVRLLFSTTDINADTLKITYANVKILADTVVIKYANINITADTNRIKYVGITFNANTLRKLSGPLPYLKNVTINIAPTALSDTFDLTTIKPMKQDEHYSGKINDFNIEVIIKKTTEKCNSLGKITNYSCQAKYDIYDLLNYYIYFSRQVPDGDNIKTETMLKFYDAATLLNYVSYMIGKGTYMAFSNFSLSQDAPSSKATAYTIKKSHLKIKRITIKS